MLEQREDRRTARVADSGQALEREHDQLGFGLPSIAIRWGTA